MEPQIWMFFYACLLELIAFGLANEITQLIFIFLFKEVRIPFIEKLYTHPPIALLCTTCDNVDKDILQNLAKQTYPNLHIFILDDSQNKESQLAVDSLGFYVLRRKNRIGYKAGSLNNWLFQHGHNFPYFIVTDADSVLPEFFVEQMVAYAEHPDNSDVAIFESLISAWNHKNSFARLLDIMTPIKHHHKLCLDNRFRSNLSVGHNNLYRTSIINLIGGFKENYLAEDTATSLELLRTKYYCMTVPLSSYERLPENFQEFVGRQSRWTVQTFQLMSLETSNLSWYTRFSVMMAFYFHFMPVVAFFGMTLLALSNIENWIYYQLFSTSNFVSLETPIIDKTLIFWVTCLLFPMLLRGIVAWRE
jgi:cellulose synthase/poly-beta-1,6-N-acetylglucosamine synthase-like glycosyltransferase